MIIYIGEKEKEKAEKRRGYMGVLKKIGSIVVGFVIIVGLFYMLLLVTAWV